MMLPFYILTHRKVGYFARGCPTIWKSSIVPPWSVQDGGTTCSDGWAINVTTGPCIDKYVQSYKYALPLETYTYEWMYWYFVFMDVHVYSCPTSQWPHDGGDMALPPREGFCKNHFYFFFLYSMPLLPKICKNDFSMTASKANAELQKNAHIFAWTCLL